MPKRSAGTSPKARPTIAETSERHRRARARRCESPRGAEDSPAQARARSCSPHRERRTPTAPPSRPSASVSVSAWRTMRPRLGAKRDPHRRFAPPSRAPGKQQVGKIDADDQQHRANRAEKQQERLLRPIRRSAPAAARRPCDPAGRSTASCSTFAAIDAVELRSELVGGRSPGLRA